MSKRFTSLNTGDEISVLTKNKIDELAHIFTTKTFDKGKDDERTIYTFSENIINSSSHEIINKFYTLGMEIDDYYYKWLHQCLFEYSEKLNEYIGFELDKIPFDDIEDEIIDELAPDIYNWDLLEWISSNLTRAYYVEDAMKECEFDSFWALLQWAQVDEMREVYQIGFNFVRWYLNDYVEE